MTNFEVRNLSCLLEETWKDVSGVNVVITSPPYNTGNSGEPVLSHENYIAGLRFLFKKIKQVLSLDGVLIFDINEKIRRQDSSWWMPEMDVLSWWKDDDASESWECYRMYSYRVGGKRSCDHGEIQKIYVLGRKNSATRKKWGQLPGDGDNPFAKEYIFGEGGEREVFWPTRLVNDYIKIFALDSCGFVVDPFAGRALLGRMIVSRSYESDGGTGQNRFLGFETDDKRILLCQKRVNSEFPCEFDIFEKDFNCIPFNLIGEPSQNVRLWYIGAIIPQSGNDLVVERFFDAGDSDINAGVHAAIDDWSANLKGLPSLGGVLLKMQDACHMTGLQRRVFLYRRGTIDYVYNNGEKPFRLFAEEHNLCQDDAAYRTFVFHYDVIRRLNLIDTPISNGEGLGFAIGFIPRTFETGRSCNALYYIVTVVSDFHLNDAVVWANVLSIACQNISYPLLSRRVMSLMIGMEIQASKSAIGSIMSRNGSHNIGSHVLAALSHNVGTMPDDRVLYQYIQNRMDYIATVTTDPPTWTQPTLLVGNLVRGFLSQYHLLEHIAESEGLGAYVFQSRSGSFDIKKENESGKIELHVRMRRGGVTNELIAYGEDTCQVDLQNDIALAIPGGVVGNHAFYTVLENVIRNAAKHGWSVRPKDERKGNLRVYVEFEEGDEDVEFTVWDNMSDVFAKTTQKNLDKPLLVGEIRDVLDRLAKGDEKALDDRPLHHLQQIKLALPLITERGSLRQENWGLAEMKISVGYLNRRSVSEIGGLDKDVNDCSRPDKRIITPVAVAGDGKADVVHHLGYRFSIPKPKDVVFVLNAEDALWIKEQGTRIDELKRYGIYFCLSDELQQSPFDEMQKKKQITSQYVVFRDFKKEYLDAGLPFRVLTMQTEQDRFRPDLIPTFTTFDSVKKLVEGAFAPKDKANDIKLLVWGRWIEFLWERRKKEFPTNDGSGELALLINTKGDAAGSGRGLITDTDLLEYVFENCVRSTIRMFKISHAKISTHCLNVLDALYGIDCYKFVRSDDGLGTDIVARISCVLAACLESVSVEREFCRSTIERWRLRYVLKDTDAMSDEEVDQYLEDRDRAFQESSEMDEFVSALRMAYDQADVFLRKYEEDISTLPSGFKVEGDETRRQYFVWPSVAGVSNEFPGVRVCFDPDQVRGYAIEYFRHFDPDKGRVSPLSLYVEPLSGSQCYMNSVNNVNCGKVGQCSDVIVVKLLEAGLMRVVIADERVAKFCRDHVSMRKTYDCLRIGVLDDKDVAFPPSSAEELSEKIDEACHNLAEETRNDLDGKKWDVFIIHQGLIDKWLFKHSTADVERLLECLKKIFPYVVVTTGRGRPANIPASARVIPFSTLENTLFKKYPEKMILVDTIMNALPVGEKKKGASA